MANTKKPGFFGGIGKFFRELRNEARKVVWPTPKQVVNNTVIVLGMIAIAGGFVWILDAALTFGIDLMLGR